MMQPVNTDYGGKMLDEVSRVLKQRADSAQLAGIPRWNIILDPGTARHHDALQAHAITCALADLHAFKCQAWALPRRLTTTLRFCDGSRTSTARYVTLSTIGELC
jgi:dihydropteroate synthase